MGLLSGVHAPTAHAVSADRVMEASAMNITTVGLDLAKNAFQAHGVDARGTHRERRFAW